MSSAAVRPAVQPIVLDGGWRSTKHAELALHDLASRLGVPVRAARTHFISGYVVVVAEFSDVLENLVPLAEAEVRDAVVDAAGGRAFVFDGHDTQPGRVTVGELLATTEIDEIQSIGGLPVDPGATIDTQGFLRPLDQDGRLVLLTRPAAGDIVVPFEQPNPTPCCAEHS